MAYEAGFKPWDLRRVTLRDFNAFYVGYRRRQEEHWDMHRRTWAYIIAFGGMGLKKDAKMPTPGDLWALQYRDRDLSASGRGSGSGGDIKPIENIEQALALLDEFKV